MVKKEISSVQNWKEAFWKIALCSVNSTTRVTISPQVAFLKKPFAKTVLVEFAKWCLEAHRGLWWKSKYLQLKTGKNLSEKLLYVLLVHLTELQLSRKEPFTKAVVVEFAKWYLEAHWGLCWKRKYPKIKTEKKLSEKLLSVLLIHLTELQLSAQEAFR